MAFSASDPRWVSDGLSEKSLEKARVELNETEENRVKGIAGLREKISQHVAENEDFKLVRDSDKFLITFLRARKYDVDRAFKLLVNYHNFRRKHADLIDKTTLEGVRPVLERGVACMFGDRDSQGRRMLMFRPALLDADELQMKDALKTLIYVLDRVIEDEETQVNGFVFIQNFADMTLGRVMMFDRSRAGIVMELFQEAFPARFKGFHVVNQSKLFSIVWTLVKPFMKQKLRDRYHMHGTDRESLFSMLPEADVPAEIDGGREPYDPYDVLAHLEALEAQTAV